MRNTTFYPREEQLPKLATSYRVTKDKKLEPVAKPFLYGKNPTIRDRFPSAEGGLLSTATDYARFCQMIYVLMIQRANIVPNGDGSEFRRAFQEAVAESLRATKLEPNQTNPDKP